MFHAGTFLFIGCAILLWCNMRDRAKETKEKARIAKAAAEEAAQQAAARERARMFPPVRIPWNDHEDEAFRDYTGKGL